ncbi:MAG: MBL fold metallo-hydrolase [Congregibacter sp.]
MRFASLGSGSRGNATLIEIAPDSLVLVDCGFSVKEMQRRAVAADVRLDTIQAIFVTHEHSDHSSGVAALSRHLEIPVYLTHGTLATGRLDNCYATQCFNADDELGLEGYRVRAVAVPHDAREPVQFVFEAAQRRIGVLTDLGSITAHVAQAFSDCDALLLEFNHDTQMLAVGPYPPALKRRVGGDWGHLSNVQALQLLASLAHQNIQHLVIAHISEKNNCQKRVAELLGRELPGLAQKTIFASQESGFSWLTVCAKASTSAGIQTATALASGEAVGAY